ncbi:MAG: di-heme-cytochrome C peroxidase, partial [Proteobacteria bacterium]|nr:di-heme-cytochrome C peroxidase [Pseudomonadota bacterium]
MNRIGLNFGVKLLCSSLLSLSVSHGSIVGTRTKKVPRSSQWLMDWSEEARRIWYLTPQGSLIVPLDIFLALRTDDGQTFFSQRSSLEKFGWTYAPDRDSSSYSIRGLPLGFVSEADPERQGVETLGLGCAACHTGQIVSHNTRYVIDGGQALVNVEAFNTTLAHLLSKVEGDPQSFKQLELDIIRRNPSSPYVSDKLRLAEDLHSASQYMQARQQRNKPLVSYGNGRIDAFTEILNEVMVDHAGLDQRDENGHLMNAEAPGAPISIPAIWTASDLECIQTNCISSNPLTRNLGESLGVFGRTKLRFFKHKTGQDLQLDEPEKLFSTSADLKNLYRLEEALVQLPAPRWPEAKLGPLDQNLIARGEVLYRQLSYEVNGHFESCASCHVLADKRVAESLTEVNSFGRQFFKVSRWEPELTGTDTAFVDQHLKRKVFGLPISLSALYELVVKQTPVSPQAMNPSQDNSALKFLSMSTQLAVRRFFTENSLTQAEQAAYVQQHENPTSLRPRVYKARPLNGIAFTAPYLHNGSVISLAELLKDPSQRLQNFTLGTLEWDSRTAGYRSADKGSADFDTFVFDTSIKGN